MVRVALPCRSFCQLCFWVSELGTRAPRPIFPSLTELMRQPAPQRPLWIGSVQASCPTKIESLGFVDGFSGVAIVAVVTLPTLS